MAICLSFYAFGPLFQLLVITEKRLRGDFFTFQTAFRYPAITANELSDKGIVLDMRARCVDGNRYNIEMRDATRHDVTLGSELQLTVIGLKKASRLGHLQGPASDWVRFFEHWRQESGKPWAASDSSAPTKRPSALPKPGNGVASTGI